MSENHENRDKDQLFDELALSYRTGISLRTLKRWRMVGEGPPFLKLGHLVRYRESDYEKWLTAQKRRTTTAA